MHEIRTVEVDGSEMEVFVFRPEDQASDAHPGIILAQHIPVGHTGIENDEFTLRTAERFADHGYVVAVPFIFHWWPKSEDIKVKRDESRDDRMVKDMQAAWGVLASDTEVANDRIAIVGHCWGGRVAWLGATALPELAACAIFYGGRIKLAMGEGNPPAITLADRIRCPVAGFFGNEDLNPTPADVDDYETALQAAGVPTEFHRYEGAGHAFQNFPTPERYSEVASEDAWAKVLEFLGRHLAPAR